MTLRKTFVALAVTGALGLTLTASAAAQTMSPADQGYMDAMSKMQKDMPKEKSGDPDVDMVRMMIPHHQAAIDMAKVHLEYGKDAKLKKMSERVIKAQEKEIKEMEAWLKKHSQQ